MSVVRVNKNSNYTVMSNHHFKEKNMSLKAKGLLSLMLSLPDNWDYTIAGLATLSSDGEASVRSALKELEEFHYLQRKRIYDNGKIADWEYNIYEIPVNELDGENVKLENLKLENLVVENQGNKINKKLSKKEEIEKKGNNKLLENFQFGAAKQPKQSLYSKCIALINAKTTNEKIRKLLVQWLNMLLEKYKDRGKTLYQNVFKGKLNTLDDYDESEWENIIKYNLQKGYETFYPVKTYSKQSNNQLDKPWEQGVTCRKMTKEQEQEHERWLQEQRAKGVKVDF